MSIFGPRETRTLERLKAEVEYAISKHGARAPDWKLGAGVIRRLARRLDEHRPRKRVAHV